MHVITIETNDNAYVAIRIGALNVISWFVVKGNMAANDIGALLTVFAACRLAIHRESPH